ncbi:tyrosine-type recombinase/integrase [Paenibacillus sp. MCAF9]|uniref:tyrosine-type recombinase/integrase n=1 Tax=Paenibacillus sp. MCAF9 TaxID=3233046 RepID=UPI003F9B8AC6
MASITYQMKCALQEINQINESKINARESNDFDNIHSIKYYKDTLDTAVKFGGFCKESFGVKKVADISNTHYESFMKFNENKGCTVGHLINLESHLLKLQIGISKMVESKKMNVVFKPFVEKRMYNPSDREPPKNRSYTQDEISKFDSIFSHSVRDAMQMSIQLGLRIREVCNLRIEFVVEKNGEMHIHIPPGEGKGITKGGRFRSLPVPAQYQSKLRELIINRNSKDKILNVKQGTLRSALKRACDKLGIKSRGWHGFRHTYARNRLELLLGDKKEIGKDIIREMLNNREKHLKIDQKIIHPDLEVVQKMINQIHSELGHGENRWGLMAVYLSF